MAQQDNISGQILNYLLQHPDASDTLKGITEWWLMSQRIRYEMEKVKAAVFKLVEEGRVIEIHEKNSTIRYKLNPKKRKEVKS